MRRDTYKVQTRLAWVAVLLAVALLAVGTWVVLTRDDDGVGLGFAALGVAAAAVILVFAQMVGALRVEAKQERRSEEIVSLVEEVVSLLASVDSRLAMIEAQEPEARD